MGRKKKSKWPTQKNAFFKIANSQKDNNMGNITDWQHRFLDLTDLWRIKLQFELFLQKNLQTEVHLPINSLK